jgi:hypothetical protein
MNDGLEFVESQVLNFGVKKGRTSWQNYSICSNVERERRKRERERERENSIKLVVASCLLRRYKMLLN